MEPYHWPVILRRRARVRRYGRYDSHDSCCGSHQSYVTCTRPAAAAPTVCATRARAAILQQSWVDGWDGMGWMGGWMDRAAFAPGWGTSQTGAGALHRHGWYSQPQSQLYRLQRTLLSSAHHICSCERVALQCASYVRSRNPYECCTAVVQRVYVCTSMYAHPCMQYVMYARTSV